MSLPRRSLLRTALGATILPWTTRRGAADEHPRVSPGRLAEVATAPVLRVDGLEQPVKIASMELLRNRRNFLVRVRATDGAEGIAVPNAMHMVHTYPIFLNRVAPFFVGKDARQLEPLLWELYRHDDNYKYQGLALWVCVAAAEFADPRPARQALRQVRRRPAGRGQEAGDRGLPRQRRTGATRPRRRSPTSSGSSPRAGRRR